MTSFHEVEDFFGVYCLCSKSQNPRFKNRVYIGFTVDPNRREGQHNRGVQFGGAKKTSNRGPWVMTMIIHGFPTKISALRFEWAWQKPAQSRILSSISSLQKRRPRESDFEYHQRILSEMLMIAPWNRLPLTIQWLSDEHFREFPVGAAPPMHMGVRCGKLKIRPKIDNETAQHTRPAQHCSICDNIIKNEANELVSCLSSHCFMVAHIVCLAKIFLGNECSQIIPVAGICPDCSVEMLWGDVIRKAKGCCDVVPDLNNVSPIQVEDISEESEVD